MLQKSYGEYDGNPFHYTTTTVCFRTKHNHCPELLAALISLYCGLRTSELSGLSSDDVDLDRMEIYIHSTVHRVKNPDGNAVKKTQVVVEELSRRNQNKDVCRVIIEAKGLFPDELMRAMATNMNEHSPMTGIKKQIIQ